ncbi:MAG: shikimate kinase [Methanolobus sp.]|nr:shikimate kinase [Methanolobus sp.]
MTITLIGMPGAGKSSVGKALAKRLGKPFIDTDDLIVDASSAPLQDIVDQHGDLALMDIEEQCILRIVPGQDCIISTGGSVVYSKKAMDFLREISTIVFLDVPFQLISRRLSNIDTRGVVGLKDKDLNELYQERSGIYRNYADIIIQVDEKDRVEDVLNSIVVQLHDAMS